MERESLILERDRHIMNREEVQLLGFEIVAYAGDARSKFLEALTAAQEGEYDKAESLIEEGNQCIADAHRAQTSLLQKKLKETTLLIV